MKSPVPLREIFEVPPRWRRLWSRMRISPRCPVGFLVWKPERRCPRWVFQAYQVKLVGWYIPIFIIYILVDMSCMDDIPSRCRLGDGNHPVIGFFLIQCIYMCVFGYCQYEMDDHVGNRYRYICQYEMDDHEPYTMFWPWHMWMWWGFTGDDMGYKQKEWVKGL